MTKLTDQTSLSQAIENSIKTNIEVSKHWLEGHYVPCESCGEMTPEAEMESVSVDEDRLALVCPKCYFGLEERADEFEPSARDEALEDITRENCKSIIL